MLTVQGGDVVAPPYKRSDSLGNVHFRLSLATRKRLKEEYHKRQLAGFDQSESDIVDESILYNLDHRISLEAYAALNDARDHERRRGIIVGRAELRDRFIIEGARRLLADRREEQQEG